MKFKVTQYQHKRTFKTKILDWWDDISTRFLVFWDFKYRINRKRKKAQRQDGELESIPVSKTTNKDVNQMSYHPNACGNSMKYIRTKGGAVVVTPASIREIRNDYKDCEFVEAAIKEADENELYQENELYPYHLNSKD